MKVLLAAVTIVVVALVAAVLGMGYSLPVKHVASLQMKCRLAPQQVWEVIVDFPSYASWRKGVVGVQRLADVNGHPVWHEVEKDGGGLQYETVSLEPGRRLVRRIAGEGLPFGGTWTFILEPHDGGTRLTITEDGEIYNPIYRFVSRFILGYQNSMQMYLSDLAGRLGTNDICSGTS